MSTAASRILGNSAKRFGMAGSVLSQVANDNMVVANDNERSRFANDNDVSTFANDNHTTPAPVPPVVEQAPTENNGVQPTSSVVSSGTKGLLQQAISILEKIDHNLDDQLDVSKNIIKSLDPINKNGVSQLDVLDQLSDRLSHNPEKKTDDILESIQKTLEEQTSMSRQDRLTAKEDKLERSHALGSNNNRPIEQQSTPAKPEGSSMGSMIGMIAKGLGPALAAGMLPLLGGLGVAGAVGVGGATLYKHRDELSGIPDKVTDSIGEVVNQGKQKFRKFSGNAKKTKESLRKAAIASGITNKDELAQFMAQTQHESGNFSTLKESTYYKSAKQIRSTFGNAKKMSDAQLNRLVANPRALANAMYGNKNGNRGGNDGYNYRGRGHIQLTGRANYREIGKLIGVDLEKQPELMEVPEIAERATIAWWKKNVRRRMGNRSYRDTTAVTKIVNGGKNGLADRKVAFAQNSAEVATLPTSLVGDRSTMVTNQTRTTARRKVELAAKAGNASAIKALRESPSHHPAPIMYQGPAQVGGKVAPNKSTKVASNVPTPSPSHGSFDIAHNVYFKA